LTIPEARRIQRVDLAYGISAGLLLVFGLLRVFFFEKGVNFYIHSPFF
jgi:putative membrane protein